MIFTLEAKETTDIIEAEELTKTLLENYFESNSIALRVRSFVLPNEALAIAEKLLSRTRLSTFRNTGEMVRIGQSHFETLDPNGQPNSVALAAYLDNAENLISFWNEFISGKKWSTYYS